MAAKKKNDKKQQSSGSKVVYLSTVMGFSLFGLFISWDLCNDPATNSVGLIVLVVSIIAFCLTLLNIYVTRNRVVKSDTKMDTGTKLKENLR